MFMLTSDQVRAAVSMPALIDALRKAFGSELTAPPRSILKVPGGSGDRVALCMPAFDASGAGMIKLSTVFPDNRARGLATIQSLVVVFAENGAPIGLMDGATVTKLRTGAMSALASSYLSRQDSAHLVVIGTGALAPFMAQAHCAVRTIKRISVVGRQRENAAATVSAIEALVGSGVEIGVADSAEQAVATADIVSCATSSPTPVLRGQWVRRGTFIDLVGSFSPHRREADDDAIIRSRIFVDTFEGTSGEAGDLIDPLQRGIIQRERIEGELADLVHGRTVGRRGDDEITLFKSVGTAIADLAAAQLIAAKKVAA